MIKVNYKLRDKDLIKNFIKVLRHYKKKFNNVDNKDYCWNYKRRFKYQRYYYKVLNNFKLFYSTYKYFKHYKIRG